MVLGASARVDDNGKLLEGAHAADGESSQSESGQEDAESADEASALIPATASSEIEGEQDGDDAKQEADDSDAKEANSSSPSSKDKDVKNKDKDAKKAKKKERDAKKAKKNAVGPAATDSADTVSFNSSSSSLDPTSSSSAGLAEFDAGAPEPDDIETGTSKESVTAKGGDDGEGDAAVEGASAPPMKISGVSSVGQKKSRGSSPLGPQSQLALSSPAAEQTKRLTTKSQTASSSKRRTTSAGSKTTSRVDKSVVRYSGSGVDVDELESENSGVLSAICMTLNVSQARALSRYRYVSVCSTALVLAWFSLQLFCCGLMLVMFAEKFFHKRMLVGGGAASGVELSFKQQTKEGT